MKKSSADPFLDSSDPRLKLTVKNKVRNIFVTQEDDTRDNKEENVNYIPVVTESSGRILQAGVNTSRKTLLLKKLAEAHEEQKRLELEHEELKSPMEVITQQRSELEIEQQQVKERATRYKEKQRIMLRNCQIAQEENTLKRKEIEQLSEQLKQLQTTQQVLKKTVAKYQNVEDILTKTLDYLPKRYLEYGSDTSEPSFMPIIQRHQTQYIIHQEALQHFRQLEEEMVHGHQQLQRLKNEHTVKKLLAEKELTEAQRKYEKLKVANMQKEFSFQKVQEAFTEKVKEVSSLLLAIGDLAERCYLPAYGPLENMSELMMLDMIKIQV
ncbi:zinc finger protein 853 isoform X2 [Thalassophryne amazonica]|uniref:zinc finger protein 853 isoform X2 n=1 Tax=Thalassophryne amazonica TaxID=390379 RepID=UPI0014721F24|nr:zinc finger protein 853 isoform X2 [Thalassophryne amazonica]